MNIFFHNKHMRINRIDNVQLYEQAMGNKVGEVRFNDNKGSATGHVDPSGKISVRMNTVDHMVNNHQIPVPHFIKIDVEGGEEVVLLGAEKTISENRPIMLVGTHNTALHDFVISFLEKYQYEVRILNPEEKGKGDIEVLAVPMH